jgi:carbon monoxide dehydrogenase subunit G
MTTLNHTIVVSAAPEQVWKVLSDLTSVQHYNPTVAQARIAGKQYEGVGASRECDLRPKGKVTERVTVWEPRAALGLEVTQSDWPIVFMKWRTNIAPTQGGTLVSQDMEYKVKFGPLGHLLDTLVMRRKLDATIHDVFKRLKQYVETRAADG